MRVISGTAKGRRLKTVPGDTTRPVMDRVKENLFNIIGRGAAGARWLDLFAGTGQVGIEALSRGAAEVIFIDNARTAIRTIQDNLVHTRLTEGAQVIQSDAFGYLDRFRGRPFDLIYVAPPQYKLVWLEALRRLDKSPQTYLTRDGVVVVQIDPKEYQPQTLDNLSLYDQRRYGSTQLCFFEWAVSGEEEE